MTNERKAILQMLLCAVLWSTGGVLIKLVPWGALAIVGVRSVITALVLGAYMLYAKIPFVLNKKSILFALSIVLVFVCYLPANKLTTAANAIMLQYTAPIYVLLYAAIFQKKRPRKGDALAVAITVLGMALFFFDQLGAGSLLGNTLALISGVFLGAMFYLGSEVNEQERYSGLLQGQILAMCIGLPFAFTGSISVTPAIIGYMLLLGVLQLGVPYILYAHAGKYCSSLTCSLTSLIEPLLNPVWVFFIIGERPSLFALFGGIVVLITITLWNIWGERQKKQAQEAIPPAGE